MSNVRRIGALLIALLPSGRAMAQDTIVVRADNAPEWGTSIRLVHLHGRSTRLEPANPQGAVTYREPVVYDVLSSAGRYLGQIRFPDGFILHHVQGNQVWGTERGELDVQYVVRYRIAR